jgi:integrase/thioredoxin reductase
MATSVLDTVVVGAGQAGLGTSYFLQQDGRSHVVFERGRIGESWLSQRWDSFQINTPNAYSTLPGFLYDGPEPEGFWHRDELISYFHRYVERWRLPVRCGATVVSIERADQTGDFIVKTQIAGQAPERVSSRSVVIASGMQQAPKIPPARSKVPSNIMQMHTAAYRNAAALPPGAVVVVGSAQSGVQIVEDLLAAGRKVYLCTSKVGRVPRRYRGRDSFAWNVDMKLTDVTLASLKDKSVKLGEKPRHTWNDAVVKWLKESTHKATIDIDKIHLRWLDRYLGGKYLDEISRVLVDRITDAKLAEGVTNATVNRTLEILRAILRKCVNAWEWLDRSPQVRMLKEPSRRIRFLTRSEAQRLLAVLPAHLADMATFSLATGLRRSNVTGLQWSQVDLVRRLAWIHPDQAKARKAIAVPLNAEAVLIIRRQIGKHQTHVFSYKGNTIYQVSTKTWYTALKKSGIENFRWHDLRHTWASWHVQQGTPLYALQELGGWESSEMVRRYAHLAAEHLAPYADRLCTLQVVEESAGGTNMSQAPKEQRPA